MAVAAGRQTLPLHLEPLSIPVLSTDPHVIGPGYQPPFAGNAEAALRAGLFSALRNDGRINELDVFLRVVVHHHTGPAENAHLRSRQSRAPCLGECIQQIIHQQMQAAVKLCYRTARLIQAILTLHHNFA